MVFWIEAHSSRVVTSSNSWLWNRLYNKMGKNYYYVALCLFYFCLAFVFFFRSRVCKCDEECSDFGDCCFDWARVHFNKTKFIHSAQTREFQCKNWFSDVSLKLDLFSIPVHSTPYISSQNTFVI